jgi:hypothetical protein
MNEDYKPTVIGMIAMYAIGFIMGAAATAFLCLFK